MLHPVFPEPTPDEELVERAKTGDEAAFGEIYDRYFSRVYRYVLTRVSNAADAEDVTAETFEKMVKAISRFHWREEASFAGWLLRIAHNQVVTHHRRNGTRPKTTALHEQLPLLGPEPADIVERKLLIEEVRAAMERLPEAQRQVLTLRFVAGLSITETAKVLGKQHNNVKVLQHKGITRLQQYLLAAARRRGAGPDDEPDLPEQTGAFSDER